MKLKFINADDLPKKERKLYLFQWNCHLYISTNRYRLAEFAEWMAGKHFTLNEGRAKTTWCIPTVERAPQWVPVSLVDASMIEYGKPKSYETT